MCNSCASLEGLVLTFIACFIILVIAPLGFPVPGLVAWGRLYAHAKRCVENVYVVHADYVPKYANAPVNFTGALDSDSSWR